MGRHRGFLLARPAHLLAVEAHWRMRIGRRSPFCSFTKCVKNVDKRGEKRASNTRLHPVGSFVAAWSFDLRGSSRRFEVGNVLVT